MNLSSLMNSLPAASNSSRAYSVPLLPPLASFSRPHSAPLPPLSIAIAKAMTTSLLCTRSKKRKGSSRVVRSILIQTTAGADKDRKSRVVFDFTEEEMAKYYHLPQRVAAKRLGVAVITIKRNCKRRGIKWPYRAEKLKEIQAAKATKPRQRCPKPQIEAPRTSAVTPMMILSEAARAYSRLPIDCLAGESAKKSTGMRC
ncbi:hypothetical protein Gpo141_00003384 [Globisporangium polare]